MSRRRAGAITAAALAALLAGCAAGGANAPAPSAARAAALAQLRGCLNRIDAGERPTRAWPCLTMKVDVLNGIARADLVAALGPAQWCYGMPLTFPGRGGDCGPNWNPAWDFVNHGRGAVGDHDLVCIAGKTARCTRVRWSTQL